MSSGEVEKVCSQCGSSYLDDSEECSVDGSVLIPRDLAALVGTLFDGRYQISSLLGYGGAGAVYKAEHERLRQVVAIKVMHKASLSAQDHRTRFEREGQVLSGLAHINVVSAHDYGVTSDGYPYLVMQFVEGSSLDHLINSEGGLHSLRAIGIFIQICDGLIYAHRKGIVHRDLKPSNIVLVEGESDQELVKIVDFGLAKLAPDSTRLKQKLTQTGSVFGTPLYMSPEQWAGKTADARSDIYSLGAMMYESMCGKAPFELETLLEFMLEQADIKPAPLGSVKSGLVVSPELEMIILKTLERDPANRYQSVAGLRKDLEQSPEYKAYWNQLGAATKQRLLAVKRKNATLNTLSKLVVVAIPLVMALGFLAWINLTDPGRIAGARLSIMVQRVLYPPTDSRIIAAEKKLAALYLQQGKYKDAADHFETVVDLLKRGSGADIAEMADAYEQLADIYSHENGQDQKATDCTNIAVALYENLGMKSEKEGQYERAISLFTRASEIRSKKMAGREKELAFALRHLADVELFFGSQAGHEKYLVQATHHYEQALAAWKNTQAPKWDEVAADLAGLGSVYLAQKKYADAEQSYEQVIALQQKLNDPSSNTSKFIVDRLDAIARAYSAKSDYFNSIKLYEKLLAMREKIFGPWSKPVEITLFALANAYNSSGKPARAEELFRKALLVEEKISGPDGAEIPTILGSLAGCQASQRKSAEALQTYERLIQVCKKKGDSARGLLKIALGMSAHLLTNLGRTTEAQSVKQELDQLR